MSVINEAGELLYLFYQHHIIGKLVYKKTFLEKWDWKPNQFDNAVKYLIGIGAVEKTEDVVEKGGIINYSIDLKSFGVDLIEKDGYFEKQFEFELKNCILFEQLGIISKY